MSCRILIQKVLELSKILERTTWKRILESEEAKTKIGETFKQIDEHAKNFPVCFALRFKLINTLTLGSLAEAHVEHRKKHAQLA